MEPLSLSQIKSQRWFIDNHGYLRSGLGRQHRLIWVALRGPIPAGCVIHHKNGHRADNRIENLELMANGQHAHLHRRPKLKACRICGGPVSKGRRYTRCMQCYNKARALADCSEEDCNQKTHGRGLCQLHYSRDSYRRRVASRVGMTGTITLLGSGE